MYTTEHKVVWFQYIHNNKTAYIGILKAKIILK
jgi:hypothetical protein